jgi:hypothetical protein
VDLDAELTTWCTALLAAVEAGDLRNVADACARAQGAGAAY